MTQPTIKQELYDVKQEIELLRSEVKLLTLEVRVLIENLKKEKEKANTI